MSKLIARGVRTPLALLAVPSLIAFSVCAEAQEKSTAPTETLQEVVVTGSRIARPDLDRLQPTTVVTAKSFDDRGYADVGQALSELPAFGVPPVNAANTQSAFGIAQSFVDLFSLGSQRTLTLVNGRRFVSSNTPSINGPSNPGQQVDLNVIPTKLIDRVETITVGGAPIYGSDAIAGTVNIILKKDYEGVDMDAQAGMSDRKDAANYRFRTLAGTNFMDNRGNVVVVGEISKADGLIGTARKDYASDLGFLAPAVPGPYKTVLTPANSVPSVNYSGIPLLDDVFYGPAFGLDPSVIGVTSPTGTLLAFGPGSSNLVPYNMGTATGNPIFNSGGDGLRLSQESNLLSPLERINIDSLLNFKITENTRVFGEAWFSETHATNLLAQPAYSTALFGTVGTANGNFPISINNPFLSPGDRALIAAELANYGATLPLGGTADPNWSPNQFYLARANIDLQSGVATADQFLTRGVLGVEGKFAIADRSFNWEIAGSYGYSRNVSSVPSIVNQNVQNALNSTIDPATGTIVCAGTPVNAPTTTLASTCAPLNPFGLGSPSAAAKAYITHNALAKTLTTQRDVTATINGDLFKLPAGEVKAALGFENRRESASFEPDEYYTLNLGTAAVTPIAGAYHTNEFFGELLVPITSPAQDFVLAHEIQLEGAARRVDNSIAGSSTTWTAGLRWSPIRDIQFRGNKTNSIRAPSVTELFLPAATVFEFANDPCDVNFINQGTAPATRAANCAAAGLPPNFVSNVVNATATGIKSGNTGLISETADARTYGVVLRPRFLPRLNITVDYIDIRLTNAIESLTLTEILDACYDSPAYPNNPSCQLFTRNAAGQIVNFREGYVNAGSLNFKGISAAFDWTFSLPQALGTMEMRASYLDTQQLKSQIGSASPNELSGEISTPAGGLLPAVKSKGSLNLNYHKGPFSWYWQGIFTGNARFDNNDVTVATATSKISKDYLGVNHWWVVNSTLGYEFTHDVVVRLIVDNVFDKAPPYPALAGVGGNFSTPTSLYWAGIIGRTYQLSADVRF